MRIYLSLSGCAAKQCLTFCPLMCFRIKLSSTCQRRSSASDKLNLLTDRRFGRQTANFIIQDLKKFLKKLLTTPKQYDILSIPQLRGLFFCVKNKLRAEIRFSADLQ